MVIVRAVFAGVLVIVRPMLAGVVVVVHMVAVGVFVLVRMDMLMGMAVRMGVLMSMGCAVAVRVLMRVGMSVVVLMGVLVFVFAFHCVTSRFSMLTGRGLQGKRRNRSMGTGAPRFPSFHDSADATPGK